jgi:hypothetical protein
MYPLSTDVIRQQRMGQTISQRAAWRVHQSVAIFCERLVAYEMFVRFMTPCHTPPGLQRLTVIRAPLYVVRLYIFHIQLARIRPLPFLSFVHPSSLRTWQPLTHEPFFYSVPLGRLKSLILLARTRTDGFTVLGQINLERFHVLVKAQRAHGPQQVVPVDRLALFLEALVTRLRRDKRNEFRYAFL